MGIGASILLIAIGAILTFALNVQVGWLDLDVVGWVMMLAGAVGLIFTVLIWGPRHRRTMVTRDTVDSVDPMDRTVEPLPPRTTSTGYRRRSVEEHQDY
ncbi:MAG TPA: DUF6458 family protein [Candidatus Limnocylindrales bacterium]|nr:DUF6458 family protein [Candidatus Limnocylindrales bacterium]